jgi:hypothetical protein
VVHVAQTEAKRSVYRSLAGKSEGNRPLGRPRHRWVENIRMDIGGIEWAVLGRIGEVQDRDNQRYLVHVAINLRVP